jgi:hypothetical protein
MFSSFCCRRSPKPGCSKVETETRSPKRVAFLSIFAGIAIFALATDGSAQQTPFAVPPAGDSPRPDSSVSALSEIMGKVQMRHIKLWYALKSRNWDLAGYELDHLRQTFETAVILYRNIPVELIVEVDRPLAVLQAAVASKRGEAAENGYAALTAACNACHRSAGIGYVFIHTPTSLPFSNQRFAPGKP